jgi:putative ABC transport system permease protein
MDAIQQDLRAALRALRTQPAFAALAVLTLALGIGAATAMFSVIQNVLLDPFPYVDANRVVMPQIRDARAPESGGQAWFKPREFLEFQAQQEIFSEVIGSTGELLLYTTREGTERLTGTLCTANTFQFLGVPALLGRTLDAGDVRPGAPPVFVMRYNFWQARFNRDPAVLGRTFVLNGVPRTLVGIMPPRFTKGDGDFYLPVAIDPANPEIRERNFRFQARLQPGVTLAQAEAALDAFAHRRAQLFPGEYPAQFVVRVVNWVDNIVRDFRRTLYMLAAAVALLLLIACANVANLLLARASTREREIAIRTALGASRGRIVRQLLLESFLLALLGMALGGVFAHFGIHAIASLIPERAIPDEADLRLNAPALLFSLGMAAITTLLFGLVPAITASRPNLNGALQDAGKGSSSGARGGKLRRVLVVAEVALSLVLLSGAGLLMRSLAKIQTQPLGLETEHVLYVPLALPASTHGPAAAKQRFFRALLPRLAALPGVVAVSSGTSALPLRSFDSPLEIRGQVGAEKLRARFELCSEGYRETLGLRLVQGRWPTAAEFAEARQLAVVNAAFVRRHFPAGDPLGRQVRLARVTPDGQPAEQAWFEIVGVIEDFKNDGVKEPAAPQVFLPDGTSDFGARAVLVRTAGEPLALLSAVRQTIWAQDRAIALNEGASLQYYVSHYAYAAPRFSLLVLGVFAGVGLVLVVLGVYSVTTYAVTRQTREFGVRLALGAQPADILRLVLAQGFGLVALGLACGAAASLAVTRVLASQLWQVSPYDAPTLVAVAALVALVGLAACYFPARRATRVDPLVALRHE